MKPLCRINFSCLSLGSYLVLAVIIVPLLSPMRAMGVFDAGVLRNMLLPPLLLFILLSFGCVRVLKPRSFLQIMLSVALLQSMLVGLQNIHTQEDLRPYLSHIFQIVSAYIMFGAGWFALGRISHKFWERFVFFSLIAVLTSTAITLIALGRGDVGRLYTPAYTFIFIAAFSAVYSVKYSIVTFFGLIVSNKRGPILSVIMIFFYQVIKVLFFTRAKKNFIKLLIVGSLVLSFVVVSLAATIHWASNTDGEGSAIARSVNITYGRILDVFQAKQDKRTLNEISAGRFDEIANALDSLSGLEFITGAGAGWSISTSSGKIVQNIHFTPLSLTAVFGAPVALFLYLYLGLLVMRAHLRRNTVIGFSTMEKMAPLYLVGALVHSFFAYSLFIDWLVFFFAGVLAKSLRIGARLPNTYKLGTT